MFKTCLFYKNCDGSLRRVSYEDNIYNIECVNDQPSLVEAIISELDLPIPFSPVLCLIQNNYNK